METISEINSVSNDLVLESCEEEKHSDFSISLIFSRRKDIDSPSLGHVSCPMEHIPSTKQELIITKNLLGNLRQQVRQLNICRDTLHLISAWGPVWDIGHQPASSRHLGSAFKLEAMTGPRLEIILQPFIFHVTLFSLTSCLY